jgi:transcriptional regulator with XRE-family HTH domain
MANNLASTSEKLRLIRKSKGWTLQDVERNSKGKWKAVVIGSYERSDRSISLKKAIELMKFYQVPITALFEEVMPELQKLNLEEELIIDQRAVNTSALSNITGLQKMVSFIAARRRDWNGEVLSLRATDLQFIAIHLDKTPEDAREFLREKALIFPRLD